MLRTSLFISHKRNDKQRGSPHVFFKKGILKSFVKFAGKHATKLKRDCNISLSWKSPSSIISSLMLDMLSTKMWDVQFTTKTQIDNLKIDGMLFYKYKKWLCSPGRQVKFTDQSDYYHYYYCCWFHWSLIYEQKTFMKLFSRLIGISTLLILLFWFWSL